MSAGGALGLNCRELAGNGKQEVARTHVHEAGYLSEKGAQVAVGHAAVVSIVACADKSLMHNKNQDNNSSIK